MKRGETGLSGQPHLAAAGGAARCAGLGDLPAGAVEDATAIGTPPDSQVGAVGPAVGFPRLPGFVRASTPSTNERLQDGIHVIAGPLDHPNGAVKSPLASFDDLEDEEPKQRVADVGTPDLFEQRLQVAAVLIGVQRQEVAVGIGVVYDPGDVDFLGLAYGSPPFY